jgi:hypothetical protein
VCCSPLKTLEAEISERKEIYSRLALRKTDFLSQISIFGRSREGECLVGREYQHEGLL